MSLSHQLRVARAVKAVQKDLSKSKSEPDADWQLWEPYPIQKKLIDCDASLVGFGGSGGGSKTTAILLAAFIKHKKSLIIRKTYPNLKEIVERAREIFFGSGGSYNSIDKLWRFGGGKIIEIGALQYEQDKENYRGREHSGLFVDEVTELPGGWGTLQFLMGWMRSPDASQLCQCVVTFNPPSTPEGEWIKEVFAPWINPEHDNPADSGEIRWFASIDGKDVEVYSPAPFYIDADGSKVMLQKQDDSFFRLDGSAIESTADIVEPQSRTFIRATLDDNLSLRNTAYRQTLKSLPEPLRSQLLYGDMSLKMEDDAWQVIPSEWVELAFQRFDKTEKPKEGSVCIGVDVARGGSDQTILAIRTGSYFEPLKLYPGTSTPDGGAVSAQVVKHYKPMASINIDVVGVGASVFDILKSTYQNVYAISGSEASFKSDKSGKLAFFNKRAEIYWLLREALDPSNGANISLPRDGKLKAELCAPRWKLVPPSAANSGKKGRIQVESKDEIKARIGRSPDRADAVCYAWAKGNTTKTTAPADVVW
jgi:hypothetical protein